MFEGNFVEPKEYSGTLSEIDGVVSTRSFETFLKWLYRGTVSIGTTEELEERVARVLEFARIADMFDVYGMRTHTAKILRGILVMSKPEDRILLPRFVQSAALLPPGHPVRMTIAKALVRPFMEDKTFRFFGVIAKNPTLGVDLLEELRNSFVGEERQASSNHSKSKKLRTN